MKKKTLKMMVPIIMLVAIVVIVALNQKPITELSSDLHIEPLNFNAYVNQFISDSIKGQTSGTAKANYDILYQIIKTEASIITASSTQSSIPLLSAQDAEELYAKAFSAYFPIWMDATDRLFASPTWSNSTLSNIKSESERLLALEGSSGGRDSLMHYIDYVNGYNAAEKLIRYSKYCNSADSYDSYCSRAKDYQGYPYKNNSDLNNIKSTVEENARNSWRSSIENKVESVCKIDNPNKFYSLYNESFDEIKDYKTKTGIELEKQKTLLKVKNDKMLDSINHINQNQ